MKNIAKERPTETGTLTAAVAAAVPLFAAGEVAAGFGALGFGLLPIVITFAATKLNLGPDESLKVDFDNEALLAVLEAGITSVLKDAAKKKPAARRKTATRKRV